MIKIKQLDIRFKEYSISNSLKCENIKDTFSYENMSAKTKYKVGLMNATEASKIGSSIRTTGSWYWLVSPSIFNTSNDRSYVRYVDADGSLYSNNVSLTSGGVRPVVSINSSVEYISGVGSVANPFMLILIFLQQKTRPY